MDVHQAEKRIESLLREGLGLSVTDQILIDGLLTYRLGAFQDGKNSIAFRACTTEQSGAYALLLCQTINHFLVAGSGIHAHAAYFSLARKTPLQVVVLHVDGQGEANAVDALPNAGLAELLLEIEAYTYQEKAESIYYRRFIRYYVGNTIYLVKPNERRFWSKSSALNDADEIIAEILSDAQ